MTPRTAACRVLGACTLLAIGALSGCSDDGSNEGTAASDGGAANAGSSGSAGSAGSLSHTPPEVAGFDVSDVVIPASLHVQHLALPGKLFVPKLTNGAQPLPAVLALHGSGGLFAMPDTSMPGTDGRPCSPDLEPQFTRWGERLAKLGYVVLMPASFDPRGFCDYYEDASRIPDDFDDDRERIIGRLYDTDASSRYLCALPEVDCTRLGMLGFSNGASTLMLALHWQLDHALEGFAMGDGAHLDLPVVPPPPGAPTFTVGIAYYPGCGLEGTVRFSTDPTDSPEDMYFPTASLFLEHGTSDTLIDDCSTQYGQGRRELQSAVVAHDRSVSDPYHIAAHTGAKHGFDNAGGDGHDEGGGSMRPEDLAARDAALSNTLDHLADLLGGARR